MKTIASLLLLFTLGSTAYARSSAGALADACGTNLVCGTYSVEDTYGAHVVTRKAVFTALSADQVKYQMIAIEGGVQTTTADEIMKFDQEGGVTFVGSKFKATGVCQAKLCSIATEPFLDSKGELSVQALVFRFTGNEMQLVKLIVKGATGDALHTSGVFKKQP